LFGFFQYTIDDNPHGLLKFSTWTHYFESASPLLPDNYGNSETVVRTYKFLGFNSQQELEKHVFELNISEIKKESITNQKSFYNALLKDNQFQDCCPEYIEQAKNFLGSDVDSLLSLDDLSLEFVFKTTLMEVITSKDEKLVVQLLK